MINICNEKTGKILRGLRVSRGLSQIAFSELLNVSKSTVCNWEKGSRRMELKYLIAAARYFDITINDFFAYGDYTVQIDELYKYDYHAYFSSQASSNFDIEIQQVKEYVFCYKAMKQLIYRLLDGQVFDEKEQYEFNHLSCLLELTVINNRRDFYKEFNIKHERFFSSFAVTYNELRIIITNLKSTTCATIEEKYDYLFYHLAFSPVLRSYFCIVHTIKNGYPIELILEYLSLIPKYERDFILSQLYDARYKGSVESHLELFGKLLDKDLDGAIKIVLQSGGELVNLAEFKKFKFFKKDTFVRSAYEKIINTEKTKTLKEMIGADNSY